MKKKLLQFALIMGVVLAFEACETDEPLIDDNLDETDSINDTINDSITDSIIDLNLSRDQILRQVERAYISMEVWYGKEEGMDHSEVATDLYTFAAEHPVMEHFTYSDNERLINNGRLAITMVEFYNGIVAANKAILALDSGTVADMDDAEKKIKSAEAHFLRAFYYWHLVESFGPVPLHLWVDDVFSKQRERASVYEVYSQIYQDINTSVAVLGEADNSGSFSLVSRDAALALRARLNLNVASYIDSGDEFNFSNGLPGGGEADLTSSVDFFRQAGADAQAVINSGKYSFYADYSDLWHIDNSTTNVNQEAIWGVDFDYNSPVRIEFEEQNWYPYYKNGQKPWDGREGGDFRHALFGMRYDVLPGMHRDLINGRPFRRYFPLHHLIDLFSDSDLRFVGQFQTSWIANSDPQPSNFTPYPTWEEFDLSTIQGFEVDSTDQFPYTKGDTMVYLTRGIVDKSRIAKGITGVRMQDFYLDVDRRSLVWDIELMYHLDQPEPYEINFFATRGREYFFVLDKFFDPNRLAANGVGSSGGGRDVYILRLSEMYLIAAEAAARGGEGDPMAFLTQLMASRAQDGKAVELLSEYISSSKNGVLDKYFFLDERARELVGEQLRWFDLKRNLNRSEWVDHLYATNPDIVLSAGLSEYHYFRPIPEFALTVMDQNPGY